MSAPSSDQRSSRPVIRWLQRFVVIAVFSVLIWLLILPALQNERGSRRNPCRNNLKHIELALHNYHDSYGSFPPAIVYGPDGKPWHSWRTLLLRHLDRADLYERYRFDEPWDGPNNRRLLDKALPVFHCPSDEDAASGTTSYLAVIGPGTMWPPDGAAKVDDATDGPSRTVHVVEVSDSSVHWMEPKDLRLDTMSFSIGATTGAAIRSRHGGAANFSLVDGSGWTLIPGTPAETVRSLLIRDDGKPAEF